LLDCFLICKFIWGIKMAQNNGQQQNGPDQQESLEELAARFVQVENSRRNLRSNLIMAVRQVRVNNRPQSGARRLNFSFMDVDSNNNGVKQKAPSKATRGPYVAGKKPRSKSGPRGRSTCKPSCLFKPKGPDSGFDGPGGSGGGGSLGYPSGQAPVSV
jgi:hypothetical protein